MSEQPQAEKQQEFKTVDIVDFSMQNNPLKVNDAFNQLISSKVVDMLANKKQEVSNNMFADKVEVEPEEEIEAEPEEVVTEPITEPEEETTEVQKCNIFNTQRNRRLMHQLVLELHQMLVLQELFVV